VVVFICDAAFADEEVGDGRGRVFPALEVFSSLVLFPLPVEFVAGGDGRPDPFEFAPGLGGAGKSGMLLGWPMNIADKGRLEDTGRERDVIE
jgi:hypothetical protein